ncbi:DNA polymerase III subunit chi [Paenirhodobacter populi]|uniref:DNA polymerase III subunit chi n=1 Tax=Paenirhodobacter populi TaxID=2306993 RepID=A0A443JJK4_9RHOB|nr:DNA polymerase III subunit chi [Sinirhodobacter populi]RWR13040.1 DNA polymerase III subunit chi [Sinirhodobacter populi]RWR20752.1 DNA polymerase III subunit chi [Sinirhodobacter populi]
MPALFYHITRSSTDEVVLQLLPRALQRGWKVELRGPTRERMEWYDQRLWLGRDEDFLPHGLAGGPHDGLQPVLLTATPGAAMREALMTIDGADVAADEIAPRERVWLLFDGRDPMAVERARDQWRVLTAAGTPAQYWSEESGRWEMKAER